MLFLPLQQSGNKRGTDTGRVQRERHTHTEREREREKEREREELDRQAQGTNNNTTKPVVVVVVSIFLMLSFVVGRSDDSFHYLMLNALGPMKHNIIKLRFLRDIPWGLNKKQSKCSWMRGTPPCVVRVQEEQKNETPPSNDSENSVLRNAFSKYPGACGACSLHDYGECVSKSVPTEFF